MRIGIRLKVGGAGTYESSYKSLLDHYDRHGDEVGALSTKQYLDKALAFKQNLKGAHKELSYNKSTGEANAYRYTKKGNFVLWISRSQ